VACERWRALVFCLLGLRDQEQRNGPIIHGKEKVYGSIP
jgi:hypothetical protein